MGTTSSSPYDIGDEVSTKLKQRNWHWTLYHGNKRGETGAGSNVSIFRANWANIGNKAPLAKHAFTKSKTLRHPKLLHLHDGSDGETECMIVTEEVTPFIDWIDEQNKVLSNEQMFSLLSYGLYNILDALNFMHTQGIVHGVVCPESIFVTKSGEFKLWGLECASNLSTSDFGHFQTSERYIDTISNSKQYRSPERLNNNWDLINKNFQFLDIWSLGYLIQSIFLNHHLTSELSELSNKMILNNITNRITIKQILNHNFIKTNDIIKSMIFLDEMQLKTHKELVMFFKTLPKNIKKISNSILIHKIMPAISSGITRSLGTENKPEECREFVSVSLPIIVEIGNSMVEEDFRRYVVPTVLPLFTVSDRSVRIQLLERIDALIQHMDNNTINETVFEAVNGGFIDTAKPIRELTLKSMLTLAPKLNEKNLNDRLMRSLTKLQSDPEASIRTNTTIFFGKIAGQLAPTTRLRIIIPVFLRAMKDPFPYGRLAAVRATSACKAFYDAPLIVGKLIPSLTPLLLDPYGPVREATFDCLAVLLEPVKAYSNEMKKEEEARKAKLALEEKERREREGPKVGEITTSSTTTSSTTSSSSKPSLANQSNSSSSSTASTRETVPTSSTATGSTGTGGTKSSLGFRTSSDSSFWDAIGDDDAAMLTNQTETLNELNGKTSDGWGGDGWDDGWGGDGVDDELDGLDDDLPTTSSTTLSPVSSSGSIGTSSTSSSINGMSLNSSSQVSPALFTSKKSLFSGDEEGGSISSSSGKKSVQERRLEAKQRRENRSSSSSVKKVEKLSNDVKTDDWEW